MFFSVWDNLNLVEKRLTPYTVLGKKIKMAEETHIRV